MEAHRKECPLEMVQCLNKCEKVLQRRYLTRHVQTVCPHRMVDCHYCHITGKHQFIEEEHKKKCPKYPLPCPNSCWVENIPREDMEAHKNECPLEMVQCEYHNVGCEERMMRKRKREHETVEMEKHLFLTRDTLNTALKKIDTVMVVLNQTVASQERRFPSYVTGTAAASTIATAK
ncbi:TNF receptor-associated factor 4-like [Dysidea avara]|uniref:TNF receptor-associated factor 4-like n=1 Tax=Dysidea avara TaxID=196820 RepID=UPI00331E5A34